MRCKIVEIPDGSIMNGLIINTPKVSKPHIGKYGLAEEVDNSVKITLDDGNILYGYQCWWIPIEGDDNELTEEDLETQRTDAAERENHREEIEGEIE